MVKVASPGLGGGGAHGPYWGPVGAHATAQPVPSPSPNEACPQNIASMNVSGSVACNVKVTITPAVGVAGAVVAVRVAGWFVIAGS